MTGPVARRGAVLAVALACGGLVGLAWALASSVAPLPVVAAAVLVLAGAAVLLLAGPRVLWALPLLLFAALPLAYLPVPAPVLTVSPPALVLLAVAVRGLVGGDGPPRWVVTPAGVLVLAFGGWLAVSAAASQQRAVAVGWLVSYGLLVLLPALLATTDARVRGVLRATWVVLGALLGAYALVETFVLQANPLFDPLYASGGSGGPLVQQWSVYRATTSLGHPVSNGAFFAVAVPLALGAALHRRSAPATLAAVLAAGGAVASGSRGAFAAMLAGAAVVVLAPTPGRAARGAGAGKALAALAVAAALVAGSAYLAVRDASGEGAESAAFRVTQVPIALQSVAESPLLGTGPGAASLSQESLLARIGGAGAFESYWLELAVGAGVPGLLLGAAVLAAAAVAALRSGAPDVAGAVVAWAVSATFVNALEGGRPEHLVLGLVLAMGLSGSSRPPARRPGLPGRAPVAYRRGEQERPLPPRTPGQPGTPAPTITASTPG